jgi:hypothetical protein
MNQIKNLVEGLFEILLPGRFRLATVIALIFLATRVRI